ncbi:MAG: hypothetical protein H0X58_08385 [Acidimicrobiia bacterium]|nr:hypothetical protein [Acidimicrobiia bacterium]
MATRKKRSISMPPDLDQEVGAAAAADGESYSAWLAGVARKELLVRAGLEAVAEFELAEGVFTDAEKSDAREWASDALERSKDVGTAPRRSA